MRNPFTLVHNEIAVLKQRISDLERILLTSKNTKTQMLLVYDQIMDKFNEPNRLDNLIDRFEYLERYLTIELKRKDYSLPKYIKTKKKTK